MSNGLGLPPDEQLLRLMLEGRSHAEIQVECEQFAGRMLARSTVSAALSQAACLRTAGRRYYETVPWRVQPEHASELPVRMLRLLARERAGVPLDDDSSEALGSWLAMLEHEALVVAYCPMAADGFVYVPRHMQSGPNPELPIRVPVLLMDQLPE